MQLHLIRERLRSLPDSSLGPLPDPPEALLPIRLDTGEGRPRGVPEGVRTRSASVLVLLFPDESGETYVVLTERVDHGGHHSGEVSFPGGSAEPGDSDPAATALREAAEEVGLDAAGESVEVVGTLPSFWIPVSGFHVTPVVAICEHRPALAASPDEVARIVEAPLASFLPGGRIQTVERTVRGWPLRYGAYPIEDLLVWGATARVLGQLGALLAGGDVGRLGGIANE